MKVHAKLALTSLSALLLWHTVAAHGVDVCVKHKDKRFVTGPEPEAHKLYRAACLANAGPWPSGFTEEDFIYLGILHDEAGNSYKIGYISTILGESGRATNRLLVFIGDGKYLGRYSDQEEQPALDPPLTLEYPNKAKLGSAVVFKNGIPPKFWIDGDNYSFEMANKSSMRTC
ncbi:hypothetical protein [Oleiagrimonas sp. C23AA]|uniref:hypothetical protein n=1 Tax=Oleiagrimonas sp. C23AA TaxID=2719047 RepID=UPI00142248BF|nr:hypothetical protein [Oleiagrimonas sp. C23AA]NII10151.1 hypothetical protein [Oleiagrimonas sp. C23AA]